MSEPSKKLEKTEDSEEIPEGNLEDYLEYYDPIQYMKDNWTMEKDSGGSFAMIGQTKSGKSTLLRVLVKEVFSKMKDENGNPFFFYIISPSISSDVYDDLKNSIEHGIGMENWNPSYMKRIRKELIPSLKTEYEPEWQVYVNSQGKPYLNIFVILDDCIDGSQKSPELKQLFLTARNNNFHVAYLAQTAALLTKDARGNANHMFIGRNLGEILTSLMESQMQTFFQDYVQIDRFHKLPSAKQKKWLEKQLQRENRPFIIKNNLENKFYWTRTPDKFLQ